ncbi:MAG: hypothetical protein HN842_12015 [Gammaproteobacteria bacterium]|nr:hypothetical protein [Gammaproteobacteria bacterium]MBT7308935.1 hypothetical protein [Gammaproteobacteria bacterium]
MTPPLFSAEKRITLLRLAALSLLSGGCSAPQKQSLSTTTLAQGARSVRGEVKIDAQPLQKGASIPDGAIITTGPKSKTIFVRGTNGYLLRENSQLQFLHTESGTLEANLTRGALLSVFAPGRVTIRTPIAHVGIRGTGCYVEAHPQKSYICLCYGEGDIFSSTTGELLMPVKTIHHDSPFNIYPSGELMEPMPAINHTDAELILLESLVGRQPDFVNTGYKNSYRSGDQW